MAAALQVFEDPTGGGGVVDWGLIDDLDELEGIISCLSIIIVAVVTIPLPLLLRVSCGLVYECSLAHVSDRYWTVIAMGFGRTTPIYPEYVNNYLLRMKISGHG